MSQIAGFHVLPAARFDDLVEAATVTVATVERRRFLFFKTTVEEVTDRFWGFVHSNTREPEGCPYPGFVLTDLESLLRDRGIVLLDVARRDLSERLSAARDAHRAMRPLTGWPGVVFKSAIPVFDQSTALEARRLIGDAKLSEADVRAYAHENYPQDDQDPAVLTILDALGLLERWLASVRQDEIGFYTVG